MGCTASRNSTLHHHTKSNSEENPALCAASCSSSDHHSPPQYYSSRAVSLQTPLVHHPPSKKGDSHHLVCLTSTTYGSLRLLNNAKITSFEPQNPPPPDHQQKVQSHNLGESLSPDSVINTWELMDGLLDEDDFDFEVGNSLKPERSKIFDDFNEVNPKVKSFQDVGFDESLKEVNGSFDSVKSDEGKKVGRSFSMSKPLWKHLSEESFLSKMDPNVVSSYRRALSSRQPGYNKESRNVQSVDSSTMKCNLSAKDGLLFPGAESKIVLYFTSLRGIRKTYEDCYEVRMIFRGFRVPVDERDISMDFTYRKELQSVLKGKGMSLPQVFIRGKHFGGVEEIRQLNEVGELAKLLIGFPVRDPGLVCESCGDARFLPCTNCCGSRKLFDEENEQLRRCPDCNENGLIRCRGCCS